MTAARRFGDWLRRLWARMNGDPVPGSTWSPDEARARSSQYWDL